MQKRIEYLEKKLPKFVKDLKGNEISVEEKYRNRFNKYARYLGNGVYHWQGLTATDTYELFLMGVLSSEKIPFKQI